MTVDYRCRAMRRCRSRAESVPCRVPSSPVRGRTCELKILQCADGAPSVSLKRYFVDPALLGKVLRATCSGGETDTTFAMAYDDVKGVWSTTATEADIKAATRSSDTPKVQLGVVAQRYPWNGTLDIQYKTLFANASVNVTFNATVGAFANKALKNVKITATIAP